MCICVYVYMCVCMCVYVHSTVYNSKSTLYARVLCDVHCIQCIRRILRIRRGRLHIVRHMYDVHCTVVYCSSS